MMMGSLLQPNKIRRWKCVWWGGMREKNFISERKGMKKKRGKQMYMLKLMKLMILSQSLSDVEEQTWSITQEFYFQIAA